MKIVRIFLAIVVFWLLLMLFNKPLSGVFGREYVDRLVDVLFVFIEAVLVITAIIAFWIGRKNRRRRVPRVVVANAAINGQPVRLIADTGASVTALMDSTAKQLGLDHARIFHVRANSAAGRMSLTSLAANLSLGPQIFTGRLPIIHVPPIVRYFLRFNRAQKVDGLFGWPGFRDNLLVFDAVQRQIRRLEELPPETAGWLKLPLRPGGVLLLEVPLPDGKTGVLLVDTGAPHGISLPPERWQQWRAAHPKARRSSLFSTAMLFMPGTGLRVHEEIWAEEFPLGPLTLTDVPLRQANHAEIRAGGGNDFAGSLGLYALARMDFIVDGKNSFAYLRPKPPPGPAYVSIRRPGLTPPDPAANRDWSLDAHVPLDTNHLLAFNAVSAGIAKRARGDLDGALAEFNHALELEPKNASAYLNRGMLKRKQHEFAGAVEDFNRVIELDPKNSGAYLIRAVTLLNTDNQAAAIADFARARELHASPTRVGLFRFFGWLSTRNAGEKT